MPHAASTPVLFAEILLTAFVPPALSVPPVRDVADGWTQLTGGCQ